MHSTNILFIILESYLKEIVAVSGTIAYTANRTLVLTGFIIRYYNSSL